MLRGNLSVDGAVIKTAGIPEDIWEFEGPAVVLESQEEAVSAILKKEIKPGDVLVIRYEGPAGGPGMQEMLHPTAFLKGAGLGRVCALITDGRFSGGSSGISVGHVSPRQPPAARSAWSRTATGSGSTSAPGPWSCSSTPRCSPTGAPRWSPPSGRGSPWTGSASCRRRCAPTPTWRPAPTPGRSVASPDPRHARRLRSAPMRAGAVRV